MSNHLKGIQGFLHEDSKYMIASMGEFDKISFHSLVPANKETIIINLYDNVRLLIKNHCALLPMQRKIVFPIKQRIS